jgi:hypothetical protein
MDFFSGERARGRAGGGMRRLPETGAAPHGKKAGASALKFD